MIRRHLLVASCSIALAITCQTQSTQAQAPVSQMPVAQVQAPVGQMPMAQARAYGANWGGQYASRNMDRFYHYPYVTYPQNYWGNSYYRSADSMYYRYPPEMRIPVYNRHWQNYYPTPRRYHFGHHFLTDVF